MMEWVLKEDEVHESQLIISRLTEWKALADLLTGIFKELSAMETMCSRVFGRIAKTVEAQESRFDQCWTVAKEFKTISEILGQSHATVGRLYEETMANKMAKVSQELAQEVKKVKKTLATQTAGLTKQRAAANGTFLEFQKVYKRSTNLTMIPLLDPWLMEVKLRKKIEDAMRAENEFKDAVLELHDDLKSANSTTANQILSTIVDFSVLKKEQIAFVRDCVDQVAKVTMTHFKPIEKPAYLSQRDTRIVPALTRRSYTQDVRYPDRGGPFAQVVKQGFMLKMKVPPNYTSKDVREDRWETVVMLVTECGFLHFFDTNDRLMTDPLHSIHLIEADISAELSMLDAANGAEVEDPFLRASNRSSDHRADEASLDDTCFEITAALPTPFFASITEKILIRTSNAMEAIDWLATLHFYKGQQGKARVAPSPRRSSIDFPVILTPSQPVQMPAHVTPPHDLSSNHSSYSQQSSMDFPHSLNTRIPAPIDLRTRSDTWPRERESDHLRHGYLSERVIDLQTLEVTWEKREVEIRHGQLTSYDVDDLTRKKSKRTMNLEGGQISVLDPADGETLLSPFGFRIFGNGDSVSFCCETDHELELWLQALRLACTWPLPRREPRFVIEDEPEEFSFMLSPDSSIYEKAD